MPTNLLIGYPAIPFTGTQSLSATASTTYPANNLITGGRGQAFELATAQFDDLYIQYDAGSSTAATGMAIARAKLLTSGKCDRLVLRNCAQPYTVPSSITGLLGWWDATRGITRDSSNLVSQWDDLSGQGNHVTQSSAGVKPYLSRADNVENRILASETFSNSSLWGYTGVTVTADATTDYLGASTADRINASAGAGAHNAYQTVSGAAIAGTSYRAAVDLKYINKQYIYLGHIGDSSNRACTVDIQAGTISSSTGLTSSSITSLGSGWYRVVIEWTNTINNYLSATVAFNNASTTSSTPSFVAAGTEQVYATRIQLQRAAADNTYAVTTTYPVIAGINGNRCLFFNGAQQMASAAIGSVAQPRTQFVVARGTSTFGSTVVAMDGNASGTRSQIGHDGTLLRIFSGTTVSAAYSGYQSTTVYSAVFDGASSQSWANGTSIATGDAGAHGWTGTTFGGTFVPGNFWVGNICEGLVFSGALSASDRQAIEAYLTAKWVTTPIYTNTALDSTDLKGPTSEDLISVFNSSSARYWWLQFGTATTSKFKHNKEFLGTFFDFGRDPVFSGFKMGFAVQEQCNREPRRQFTIKWEAITNTIRNSFISNIYRYRDVSPVMLYDQGNYLFNGAYAIHAVITGARYSNRTATTSDVEIDFEELI